MKNETLKASITEVYHKIVNDDLVIKLKLMNSTIFFFTKKIYKNKLLTFTRNIFSFLQKIKNSFSSLQKIKNPQKLVIMSKDKIS